MPAMIQPETKTVGVAQILANHIADYQNQYPLWWEHKKIVFDLLNCRTVYLGGPHRSLRPVRGHTHRLSFVPQSPLPHLPTHAA